MTDISVESTHLVTDGMHGAIIKAIQAGTRPVPRSTARLRPTFDCWQPAAVGAAAVAERIATSRASRLEELMLGDFPIRPVLLSTDLAATRAFYHDQIGMEILTESPERIEFRAGETRFIVTHSTLGTSDRQTQARFEVPDLKAALADLRGRGVRIEEYEAPDPPTTNGIADMGFAWAAWFLDPGSNAIAVIQFKDAHAAMGDESAERHPGPL